MLTFLIAPLLIIIIIILAIINISDEKTEHKLIICILAVGIALNKFYASMNHRFQQGRVGPMNHANES